MTTIHVPSESISQFLPVDLHIKADGNQNFWLRRILVDYSRIVVIKTTEWNNSVRLTDSGTACIRALYKWVAKLFFAHMELCWYFF